MRPVTPGMVGHWLHGIASDANPARLVQSHASSIENVFVWFPFTEQVTTAPAPKH